MKVYPTILLLFVFLTTDAVAMLQADDQNWPMFRLNHANTGTADHLFGPDPDENIVENWVTPLNVTNYHWTTPSPAIYGDTLYVGGTVFISLP